MPYTIVGKCTDASAIIWISGYPSSAETATLKCWKYQNNRKLEDYDPVFDKQVELTKDIDRLGVMLINSLDRNQRYFYRVIIDTDDAVVALEGAFKTFGAQNFSFLLMSCHVPVASLSKIVGFGGSMMGLLTNNALLMRDLDAYELYRAKQSEKSIISLPWRYLLRISKQSLASASTIATLALTGGKLGVTKISEISSGLSRSSPVRTALDLNAKENIDPIAERSTELSVSLIDSPFRYINQMWWAKDNKIDTPESKPLFAIHAGDQIYADFPRVLPESPDESDYNAVYREAWYEDPHASRFLASLPNYMILDDHEIWDSYGHVAINALPRAKDSEWDKDSRDAALRAYRQYVHSRVTGSLEVAKQITECLYYSFEQGSFGFFVMDTRTERRPTNELMISENQLNAFLTWLKRPHRIKFIISSVPFLAEFESTKRESANNDSWSGRPYRNQRLKILNQLYEIGRNYPVVILTGDLHCCYHIQSRIRRRDDSRSNSGTVLHELAAGPVYQYQYAKRSDFSPFCRDVVPIYDEKEDKFNSFEVTTELRDFYTNGNAVMQINVVSRNENRGHILEWRIVTTTESRNRTSRLRDFDALYTPANTRGRISLEPGKHYAP